MLGLAGLPLGMNFRFMDPSAESPAREVGELVLGGFEDAAALDRFVRGVELITFEFENVPAETLLRLEGKTCVFPGVLSLQIGQDRAKEKALFTKVGIPVPEYAIVNRPEDVTVAAEKVGTPCVVKTLRMGYDGKGQATAGRAGEPVLRGAGAAAAIGKAWQAIGAQPAIVERMVAFEREVSILGVRSRSGECRFYAPVENVHEGGILRRSIAPAGIDEGVAKKGFEQVRKVMEALGHVGVMAVEFFVVGGELLANEMAPRVHNSGHWTIEGAVTSQFENHLRAVSGLALGPCESRGACGMVNLIGDAPATADLAKVEGAKVHLYGKRARAGRKIGHVTVVGEDMGSVRRTIGEVEGLIAALHPRTETTTTMRSA